jgi:hypothetical protein
MAWCRFRTCSARSSFPLPGSATSNGRSTRERFMHYQRA